MFLELLGKKIITFATPYRRAFLTIDNAEKTLTLPSIRSAVFFLNQGDEIYLDNMDELNRLCYIDYDLLNEKDKNFIKYIDDFRIFKETVKAAIATQGYYKIIISNKVIYSDVLHIICTPSN